MRQRSVAVVILLAMAFVAANLAFYTVDETETAVLTQFGRPIAAITEPGLYTKWPDPIQTVQRFNKRLQVFTPQQAEYLTADKKAIRVETYVAWQLTDPIQFLVSIGDKSGAEIRLADIVNAGLGQALGQYELAALVTTPPRMRLPPFASMARLSVFQPFTGCPSTAMIRSPSCNPACAAALMRVPPAPGC